NSVALLRLLRSQRPRADHAVLTDLRDHGTPQPELRRPGGAADDRPGLAALDPGLWHRRLPGGRGLGRAAAKAYVLGALADRTQTTGRGPVPARAAPLRGHATVRAGGGS